MGVAISNRKTRFATMGARFQRHNSDGTIAVPGRFVGFANTADLSKVLNNRKGAITIRVNAEPAATREIDFSDVNDLTNVTVAEAVAALNDADFPDIVFSIDPFTGRLRGTAANAESFPIGKIPGHSGVIQVLSPLAAALDFGQGIKHGGNGLEWISFFDDGMISIGLPKDIKDREEIDQEGAMGTLTRIVINEMLLGISPTFTLKEKDYFLLELIQGGRLDRETGTYNPPLSRESERPTFCAEIFSPLYTRGTRKLADMSAYERIFLRSMTGIEGDVPIEQKSLTHYIFNTVATEYIDEAGKEFPAWEEQTISCEDCDGLRLRRIKVAA